jgi:hypothetical protein
MSASKVYDVWMDGRYRGAERGHSCEAVANRHIRQAHSDVSVVERGTLAQCVVAKPWPGIRGTA